MTLAVLSYCPWYAPSTLLLLRSSKELSQDILNMNKKQLGKL